MTEPFFFDRGRGLTVGEIATLTGAEPRPGTDLDRRITGIASIDRAAPNDLAFLDKPKYAAQLSTSGAGACLTTERYAKRAPEHIAVLCLREPYRAFVEITRKLFPGALRPSSLFEASGIAVRGIYPSRRAPGKRRDGGSRCRDRAGRRDRDGHRDQRRRGHRTQGAHRAPMRDRRQCVDRQCLDRRPRGGAPRLRHRAGRVRLCDGRARATARSRRSAGSSCRTTWRSAPGPPSTAAPTATP